MLTVKNFTAKVGNKTILRNFNFTFKRDNVYAVMGPNGSGKSTLAYAIMGHPAYVVNGSSKLIFNKKNILPLDAGKRANLGIFLSFQNPLSLTGIKVRQLLQLALQGKKDPLKLRQEIEKHAKELKIKPDLLERSLNDGASGGEKKKLEVLQAAVLDKELMIFDEVDTGVDIDALKSISEFLHKNKKGKTYIVITHYNRILHYLKPDKVLILIDGKLKKVGNHTLAVEIEKNGYGKHTQS